MVPRVLGPFYEAISPRPSRFLQRTPSSALHSIWHSSACVCLVAADPNDLEVSETRPSFPAILAHFFLGGGCFLLCPSLPLVLSNSKPTAIIILVISGLNPQKAAACPDFPQKPDQSQGSLGKLRQ